MSLFGTGKEIVKKVALLPLKPVISLAQEIHKENEMRAIESDLVHDWKMGRRLNIHAAESREVLSQKLTHYGLTQEQFEQLILPKYVKR